MEGKEKEVSVNQSEVNTVKNVKTKKRAKKFSLVTALSLILITLVGCVVLLFVLSNKFISNGVDSRIQAQIAFNEKQVDKKPNDPALRVTLGYSYFLNEDYSAAIEQYETALKLNKKHYPAMINLAIVYEAQEKTNKALTQATNATKIAKQDYRGFEIIGRSFRKLKDYDKAIEALKKANELNPSSATILYELGQVYEDKKDIENAIVYYKAAVDFNPVYKEAVEALNRVKKSK